MTSRHAKWVLAAVAVIAVIWFQYGRHNGPTDNAGRVTSESAASSCSSSGYYMSNTDGSGKQIIYDCTFPDGRIRCVTEHGGIASDSTVEVRLLFASTLGGGKPVCVP